MKKGIKVLTEEIGSGTVIERGDRIRVRYDLRLSGGDLIQEDAEIDMTLGDRGMIAGLNYGLEGMRSGGRRTFKAAPHLCYREQGVPGKIPPHAVLVFEIRKVELLS